MGYLQTSPYEDIEQMVQDAKKYKSRFIAMVVYLQNP
jgi:hypothetical protein